MTLKQVLGLGRGILEANNIEDASLEAEILLRHVLGIDRARLYTGLDGMLSLEEEERFRSLIERRLKGEPSAYITGHREFYGLDFCVAPGVLIPRPESELLVEKSIALAQARPVAAIAEIGTGCGAIAISLALSLPGARIYATDISAPALRIARRNCQKHSVSDRVILLHGDMLDPLPEPVDLIVANLPYVKEAELARSAVGTFEPRLALNGGADGLEKIDILIRQVSGKLHPDGCLLLEVGQGQAKIVAALLRRLFRPAGVEVFPDYGGIERVVSLKLDT